MDVNYKSKIFMITIPQIKQIHTLKNVLGLDDDLYREMLSSFGVYSSKDLTEAEARIFIDVLNDKLKKICVEYTKKYDEWLNRSSNMATPPQLRKMEAIWNDLHPEQSKIEQKKSLRNFLKTKFHINDIRFLSKPRASVIIAVLEKIKFNKFLKAV